MFCAVVVVLRGAVRRMIWYGDDRAGSGSASAPGWRDPGGGMALRRVLSHSGAHVLTFFFLPSILASFGAACINVTYITVVFDISH